MVSPIVQTLMAILIQFASAAFARSRRTSMRYLSQQRKRDTSANLRISYDYGAG